MITDMNYSKGAMDMIIEPAKINHAKTTVTSCTLKRIKALLKKQLRNSRKQKLVNTLEGWSIFTVL